jgi:cation transport regulator ChaC
VAKPAERPPGCVRSSQDHRGRLSQPGSLVTLVDQSMSKRWTPFLDEIEGVVFKCRECSSRNAENFASLSTPAWAHRRYRPGGSHRKICTKLCAKRGSYADCDGHHRGKLMPDGSVKHVKVLVHPAQDRDDTVEYIGVLSDALYR